MIVTFLNGLFDESGFKFDDGIFLLFDDDSVILRLDKLDDLNTLIANLNAIRMELKSQNSKPNNHE